MRPTDIVHNAIVAAGCFAIALILLAATMAYPAMLSGYQGGGSGGGGAASNSFETIHPSSGTDPVADSSTDTLNMSGTAPVTVTGDSTTDTVTFSLADVTPDCAAKQFVSAVGANGALTCGQPSDVTGNAATASALAADPTDCTLPNVALGINASGVAQCSQPSNVTGNAATATALATNPTACGSNLFVTDIADTGTLTCTQPSFSNLSGTLALSQLTDDATASKCLLSGGSGGDPAWTTCPSGGGSSNSFETISVPSGTNPVATSATDTLTLAASGIVSISGNSTTDTVTISATEVDGSTSNEIQNLFQTISTSSGTSPVADTSTDTLTLSGTAPVTVTGNDSTDTVTIALADVTPDCSAKQFVSAVGANGALTCGQPSDVTGNAATATALAATPTGCTTNQFANAIAASGNLTCAQPAFTDISGTLGVTKGGTGLTTVAQGDLLYGSASNTLSTLAKDANATRYLSNTGTTNNPAWAQVNLADGVTGTLPGGNGGTGSTLVSFTGPTLARTFTVPDATTTLCGTNSVCTGYQAGPLTGDVTTSGAAATIGNDKVLEAMLKAVDAPADEECLTYEATGGDFEWQSCGSGSGDVTDVGDCTTGACFTGSSGNTMTFKGATSGTIALKPAAVAGSNTITMPAETGTVCTTGSVCSGYGDVTDVGPACASGACLTDGKATTGTSMFVWEGTTVDTSEITVAMATSDPVADQTITIPNETGTVCTTGSVCSGYQADIGFDSDTTCNATSLTGTGVSTILVMPTYDNTNRTTMIWWSVAVTSSSAVRDWTCAVYDDDTGFTTSFISYFDDLASGSSTTITGSFADTTSSSSHDYSVRCNVGTGTGTTGSMNRCYMYRMTF